MQAKLRQLEVCYTFSCDTVSVRHCGVSEGRRTLKVIMCNASETTVKWANVLRVQFIVSSLNAMSAATLHNVYFLYSTLNLQGEVCIKVPSSF